MVSLNGISSFFFIVFGHFVNRSDHPLEWRKVKIGYPFRLVCPPHSYTYPKSFKWGVRNNFIQEDKHKIILPNGDLFFTSITQKIIDGIRKQFPSGMSCILEMPGDIGNHHEYSRKFLLYKDQQSKYLVRTRYSLLVDFAYLTQSVSFLKTSSI